MRTIRRIPFLVLLVALASTQLFAQQGPIISREILFGNPERAQARISPDGTRLAWLAPDTKNVLQVWVRTIGKDDGKIVTADKKRGIRQYSWAPDNETILYGQDNDGDENFHVYGVALTSGIVRDYTPFQGVRAEVNSVEPDIPDTLLVSMNARNKQFFDIYRLTLSTGALVLDTQNPGDVLGFEADKNLTVRMAQASTPDGGTEIRVRDDAKSPWRTWVKAGPEDNLDFIAFSADGKSAYISSSLGSDTARLIEKNIATGAEKVIASSDEVDLGAAMINPNSHKVEAVSFAPGRTSWKVIDPAVKDDFDGIAKLSDGDFAVVNRDRADKTWLVAFTSDRGPTKYFSWDRAAKKGTFLFTTQPKLENLQLSEMKSVVITTRDGMKMHAYLTLPAGIAPTKLPMVLFPHGGPWARDTWGFNPYAQWLANRGYAVLMPNFRGSTGFGKKFLNAGDKQWGLKMHDDLIDAVNWAVKSGYADPARIAIMGGSYGGYAVLAGLTYTPDTFSCGVDLFGPSNLKTLLAAIPPYWQAMRAQMNVRMGNPDDPKDADLIHNASPLFKANQIKKPLLIGQGLNDPRVNPAESQQVVDAIQKNHGSVIYVTYSDEGHGFRRPENSIDFNARAEAFLANCLGGRVEPMQGDKIAGSSAVVVVGGK